MNTHTDPTTEATDTLRSVAVGDLNHPVTRQQATKARRVLADAGVTPEPVVVRQGAYEWTVPDGYQITAFGADECGCGNDWSDLVLGYAPGSEVPESWTVVYPYCPTCLTELEANGFPTIVVARATPTK